MRANTRTAESRPESIMGVILLSLFFLGAAHLCVKSIFTNEALWVIGGALVATASIAWIAIKKSYFDFLLILFICVHFNFAENQGGFWSYVFCAATLGGWFFVRSGISLSSVPHAVNALIIILALHQFVGTVLNGYSLFANIQASVVALSQIAIFYYCASQQMSVDKTRKLLLAWFLVACWIFLVGLNQRHHWIITSSPLLPQRELSSGALAPTPAGSFGNSELFGEYFCILFALSLVFVTNLKELKALRITKVFLIVILLISISAVVMSGSRAAVLLAIAAIFYLSFLNILFVPSGRSLVKSLAALGIACLAGLLIWSFSALLSVNTMLADFQKLDPARIDIRSIVGGQGINRGELFTYGVNRLKEGSWWVGHGYNLPHNNRINMGFKSGQTKDFHNLYLSLPFFYGWLGSISYVLLVFYTGARIYSYYLASRKKRVFIVPVSLGLGILWGIFVIDQYKIGATRNPSYFLMTWMWLGLTHAIANSLRKEIKDKEIHQSHSDPESVRYELKS